MRGALAAIVLAQLGAPIPRPIDPARDRIVAAPIAPGVAVLYGRGGNVGVVYDRDGVVLIDGEFEELADATLAAVLGLDPGPIRFLIDTHWHRDHTGLNARVAALGGTVVAQENVRKRLALPQFTAAFSRWVPAAPPSAWPGLGYRRHYRMRVGGETIRLVHVPRAHTDGDTLVKLERANVLFTGDVFTDRLPFIELASNGSIDGLVAALDRAVAMSDATTRIVPGHGPVTDRAALARYRVMVATVRARVAARLARGETLAEVSAARLAAAWDRPGALPFQTAEKFVEYVYRSLSARRR